VSDLTYDILVLGSGAAGLGLALEAPGDARIAVLSKGRLDQGATNWAQGGVASVLGDDDSFASHIEDTLVAGAGLCDPETVRFVVERGPDVIRWLVDLGIELSWADGAGDKRWPPDLTLEGGHSRRRIVHAQDATGRAIQACLESALSKRRNVEVFEGHIAVDLIIRPDPPTGRPRCVGAYVLDLETGRVRTFRCRALMLAAGGASRVYLYSSNPAGASGDGIAMAWRAGCRVANMEFMQFHPTCLYHPQAGSFLISEAVRGEGGLLKRPDGSRFMEDFDPRGELAPRDVVARAIDHEMKRLGVDSVFLDISHKPADFIRHHFPTLYGRCLEFGLDMTKEPVPVVPAAHYTCGGVMVDLRARTDVMGLYAAGECTYTGLHGANRLASNSILECLVFARAAAADVATTLAAAPEAPRLPDWDESWVKDSDEEVVVAHNWDEIRRFMWDYVGIVRTDKRLARAKRRIDMLLTEINDYYSKFRISSDLVELRNLAMVADLIIRSAQARRESRGLHFTLDCPGLDKINPPTPTILEPSNYWGWPAGN
jgi:L-aspartate oxidase